MDLPIEVALVVFLAIYLVGLALCLAHQGRSFGKLEFPGGGGVEPQDPGFGRAADGMREFEEEMRARFGDQDESTAALERRRSALEDRNLGERVAALEDRLRVGS